jgi:hypothetical protein
VIPRLTDLPQRTPTMPAAAWASQASGGSVADTSYAKRQLGDTALDDTFGVDSARRGEIASGCPSHVSFGVAPT